jgi:superfamily I DNA and/or RNA helicase
LRTEDILVVAPYNYQVNELSEHLGPEYRVGTVDKFQGQEAPVVILSMCASDPSEAPRGTSFLFDLNRLNVAISRGQAMAIVVRAKNLENCVAKNLEEQKLIGTFFRLIGYQEP